MGMVEKMIDENYKHKSLTKAWCGMCNYFTSISENGSCEKCPFKDSELCYDANEECDYDKFEELIKGLKINGENKKSSKIIDELFKQFLKELDEAPDYVKENTMCYFWHNTSACTKCPKNDCKAREPRKIEPKKPHKLIDDFNNMKSCPYHDDWHYCCRCNFESICKWSNHKNKEALKRYIKENWGK